MTTAGSDVAAAIIEFERKLLAFGLATPPGGVEVDGEIHRIHDAQHHRRRNYAGWYVLHNMPSGLVIGWYGSWWRDRGKETWTSRGHRTFTRADRNAIAEQKAKIAADLLRHHQQGEELAAGMLLAAKTCNSHPYLERKWVRSHGLRVLDETTARSFTVSDFVGDLLLIPINDFDGNLRGLQWIDADGKKRYSLGSVRERATCFVIGNLDNADHVAVVEGYATGATVHEATGWPVVVAFDAGGVEKIAKPLHERLPKATLIFAGDNDPEEKGCKGQKAAFKAARLAGGVVALPNGEGDDWNDHAAKHGLKDVRARLVLAAGIIDLPATVTLADGIAQLDGVIGGFFDHAQAWHDLPEEQRPTPPAELAIATMGAGKSRMARARAGQLLKRNAAATVGFALPLHRLTAEQAAAFENETGHNAAIWRGMDQPDPDHTDGQTMCLQPDLSKAAKDAGASMSSICAVCPSRNACGYRRQRTQKARAWYFSHQLLFHTRPKAIPPLAAMVIDEKFHDAAMAQDIRLAASTLGDDLLDVPHLGNRALLSELRGLLRAALKAAAARASTGTARVKITKADLTATGLTADLAHEAWSIEWSRKPKPMLSGNVSDMVKALEAMARRFTIKVPTLWELVEKLMRGEHETSSSIEVEPSAKLQGGDGFGLLVRMHYRLGIHASWQVPTLMLDGTARAEIVRHFFPELLVTPEVHIEAPHQRVTWVRRSFAKARFVPTGGASERRNKARENNVEDLRRFIEVKAAKYRGLGAGLNDILVITNQDIEARLVAGRGLPANVAIEHFNNVRGTNDYEHVQAVVVIGRTLPDVRTIQRQAERLAGHPLDQTDPLLEAVRWSICEAELLQVIARARPIRRTADNPLDVFLLGDTPLPLKVDRTVSWAEAQPHPLELLAARGLVPDCRSDTKGYWNLVAGVLPDVFGTPDAARVAFMRSREQTSMSNVSIDKCSPEKVQTYGQDVNCTTDRSSLSDDLSREQMSIRTWQPYMARPHGGRFSIPVLVDPVRRRDLEDVFELKELTPPEALDPTTWLNHDQTFRPRGMSMAQPISQEARQRMSRAQRSRHLTIKQEKFIKAYARTGNGTQSARLAGYSDSSDGVLKQQAVENLRKPAVKQALKQELSKSELNITPLRVQRRLDEISHEAQAAGQYGSAVRCEELLGRSLGMFIDRSLQLSGQLSDPHITALLELAKRRQLEPVDLSDDETDM